jgi:hypothetical protein
MRILTILSIGAAMAMSQALTMAANANAAPCHAVAVQKVKFSDKAKADEFFVEAFGETCAKARVVIYVRTVELGWFPLHVSMVSDFGDAPANTGALNAILKETAGRIEASRMKKFETWAELEIAKTQPDGNPIRLTPLGKAEYERIVKLKPMAVIIPTDMARGKMIAWVKGDMISRPVELVYYGD